jgi:hypothetical protein
MTKQEWQPIESAPRDGTPILLCHATSKMHAGSLPVLSGHWSRLSECWWSMITNDRVRPSHWMPLPDPPADKSLTDPDDMGIPE